MGSKKVLPTAHIIISGAMTGTSTITNTTNITNLDNMALQVEWSGTPTGTITIALSVNNITFYPLTFEPAINQPAGSAGGVLANINQASPFWLEISYTNISGSGTLNAWIEGKDLN